MKNIEIKKVASANEAIAIINRLNYMDCTFEYEGTNHWSDDRNIKCRHFGTEKAFSIVEIVKDDKLAAVRFYNLYRDITVELQFGDITFGGEYYDRFDNIINVDANVLKLKAAKKLYKVIEETGSEDEREITEEVNKLHIILSGNRTDVTINVECKTLKGAYKVFQKAVAQAVEDGALDPKVAEFAYFADDVTEIDFGGKDYVAFYDNLDNSFAFGIDDNSDCDLGFYFWFWVKDTEAEEKLAEANELNGISEDMYKKMASVKWLTYTVGTNGKAYWFEFGRRTTQKRAQEILAEYGLTIEEYIGNLDTFHDEALQRYSKSLYVKTKIWYDRQPLNDDDVFNLLPEVSELNDVDENEIEQASEPAIPSHEDEPKLTVEQIQALIDATIAERTEAIDALEEAEADEEISQEHIAYLKGYIDELLEEYNDLCKQMSTAKAKASTDNPPANNNPPAPEIPPTVQAATEKLAEINSTAPEGLEIIYDAETKKFPVVSYNDKFPKIFYELDSLALYNALPIEKFWKRIERGCYTDEEEIEWLEDSIAHARGMREDFAADENPDLDLLGWLDLEIADREGELTALKAKMSNIG